MLTGMTIATPVPVGAIEEYRVDAQIERRLRETGQWHPFLQGRQHMSAPERRSPDGGFNWLYYVVDPGPQVIDAYIGLAEHPKPEDNGYLLFRVERPSPATLERFVDRLMLFVQSDPADFLAHLIQLLGGKLDMAQEPHTTTGHRGRRRRPVSDPTGMYASMAGGGPRPKSVTAVWSPDEPLNLALYNPIMALGLIPGTTPLMPEEHWITAMTAEAQRRGPVEVFLDMQESIAALLHQRDVRMEMGEQDRANFLATYERDGAAACWKGAVDTLMEVHTELKRPPEPTAEDEETQAVTQGIAPYGLVLAAIAWQGYQAKGRGVLVVDLTEEIGTLADGTPVPVCAYVPAAIMQQPPPGIELGDVSGYLQRYDPKVGMVVLVMRPGGRATITRSRFTETPPQAYGQIGHLLPPLNSRLPGEFLN